MKNPGKPQVDPNFKLPHPTNQGVDPFKVIVKPNEMHHKGPKGKAMAEEELSRTRTLDPDNDNDGMNKDTDSDSM